MSIEIVTREAEEFLSREGDLIISNKGFKTTVYEIDGSDYYDKDGLKYKIVGYAGGNKVVDVPAGVSTVVTKAEPTDLDMKKPEVSSEGSDKEAKKAERQLLFAQAEQLGLTIAPTTPTASLKKQVEEAIATKEDA